MTIMRFSTLIWSLSLAVRVMAQSTPSTITLCADPAGINPCTSSQPLEITLSKPVILTAMVPQQATGRVTFYDGTTILGISTVFGGSANWAANFLPSGTRILHAIYWGDATFSPSTSNKLEIDVAADTVSTFTPGPISPFAVGNSPNPPVVGDFNGDGVLDIAILNQLLIGGLFPGLGAVSPSFLTVLLGDGNGGFIPVSETPAVQGSTITVGDFNGDGNLDIAIPDGSQSVQIWLGNGKGSFTSASQVPAGQFPFQAAVGDFNLDGKPDLAVAGQSGQVTVLEGDGAGGFTPFPASPLSCGSICMGLAVGDFNGDGFPDLAVVDYGNGNQPGKVTIFSGDGRGSFTQSSSFPTGTAPYFVVAGDLNGDGLPDLVIANKGSNTVSVWLANAGPTQPVAVGNGPITLALGDFNGDGKLDLAVANTGDSSVSILLGDGNGGFTPFSHSPYPVGNFPFIVTGDFNRDGLLDFATANYKDGTVSVMKATTGLSIGLSAAGGLTVGQQGTYNLIVTNSGAAPISGTVTVTFTLPNGLTPGTPSGAGWLNCSANGQTATCLREDSLPQGAPYPTITLPVTVGGAACPSANVSAVVTNTSIVGSLSSSVSTSISQCVNVTVQSGPLVVNTSVKYSLIVSPAQGATPTALTVTDVLPAGLTPSPGSGGSGWNCAVNPPLVVCSWPGPALTSAYPTININVSVSAPACPNTTNVVQIQHDTTQLDVYPSSVAVHGCLSFSLLSSTSVSSSSLSPLTFNSTLVKNPASATLQVTSIDTVVLQVGASLVQNAATGFSYAAPNCSTLGPRATCQIQVNFLPACPGQQSATLSVSTNYGNLYSIPLSGLAVPRTVSFTLGGQPLSNSSSNTVSPYPGGIANPPPKPAVGVAFDPPPDSSCPQQPTIALTGFSNSAPGGLNWDVSFDSNTNLLTTGTVAGTITLTAQVAGANITATDGSGSVQLQVPASTGVVTGATIANKSSSSFEITVNGYSTPHDTANPTTAVCFSFAPASGSQLQPTTQSCALQQDILIWYQRSASIPTGSQFTGTVVVPFNGDAAAIGQISLWIENSVTQTNPNEKPCIASLDYQSGAYQACK